MNEVRKALQGLSLGHIYKLSTYWKDVFFKIYLTLKDLDMRNSSLSFDISPIKNLGIFDYGHLLYLDIQDGFCIHIKSVEKSGSLLITNVLCVVPAPCFVQRSRMRVDVPKSNPIFVSLNIDNIRVLSARAVDVCTNGIGIVSNCKDGEGFLKFLFVEKEGESLHKHIDFIINLPNGKELIGYGELRDVVIDPERDTYRFGFSINLEEDSIPYLEEYIKKRQDDILKQMIAS